MNRTYILAAAGGAAVATLVAVATAAMAGGPPPRDYPTQIAYVPAERLEQAVTRGAVAGRGSNELVPRDKDLGVRVSLGRKLATPPTTDAEAHSTFGHVYLVEAGSGTLVLGGQLVDPKEGSPGEWRGRAIAGGREFQMKKGDMITVQVGMPHWWRDVGADGVAYLAFHSFPEHNQPGAKP